MKKQMQDFAQGLYDGLCKQGYGGCFTLEELQEMVLELYRSIINKVAVLIGIGIVAIYLGLRGTDLSWLLPTSLIFWLAWVVSTSVIARFFKRLGSFKK